MRAPLTGTKLANGSWRIVVTLTDVRGKKIRKTITRKTQDAVKKAAKEYLLKNGRRAHDKHTVAELLEECQRSRWADLKPNTQTQYNRFGKAFADRFAELDDIRDLTAPLVSGWIRELSQGSQSGRTIQIQRNVVGIMMRHARELGWFEGGDIWEVRLTKSAKPKPSRRLTYTEAKAAIEAEDYPERALFWWLLMETALRPIEASTMTKARILYSQDAWWVRVAESKTAAGEDRVIPVSDELGKALYDWPEDPLFPTMTFTAPGERRNTLRRWHRALDRAGVPETNLYALRKLRITLWRAAGVPDDVVQRLAGHTDIGLTINVYDDITKERIKRAFEGKS